MDRTLSQAAQVNPIGAMPKSARKVDRMDGDARRRTKIVWSALLASMTCVGGLLLVLQNDPLPKLDGLALASTGGAGQPSIEAIFQTRTDVDEDRWLGVIIHHSGSPYGSAETIASDHRARNLHGLGYHFVIGNGNGADDGELHVGYRWLDQLPGAFIAGPDEDTYNRRYIGVCLVGDGDRRPFTESQIRRVAQLVAALQRRLHLPADSVRLGRDLTATTSPGRYFPESLFREQLQVAALRD